MTADRNDLMPCPFCGPLPSDRWPHPVKHEGGPKTTWRVVCPCGAEGSTKFLKQDAIAAWNTRALSSRPAPVEAVPVAWLCPDTGELSSVARVHWVPLYATPTVKPQAGEKV